MKLVPEPNLLLEYHEFRVMFLQVYTAMYVNVKIGPTPVKHAMHEQMVDAGLLTRTFQDMMSTSYCLTVAGHKWIVDHENG